MGPCRKCGCQSFRYNFVSATQKLFSGFSFSFGGVSGSTIPVQDNKSDQVAYRNCLCGHHFNYH